MTQDTVFVFQAVILLSWGPPGASWLYPCQCQAHHATNLCTVLKCHIIIYLFLWFSRWLS